ncbi:MAG TPA: hypothetical protein VMN57_06375 [Anaerolineales bacterium]|nr:hypothetical protein [Anaerolineales bacterium]
MQTQTGITRSLALIVALIIFSLFLTPNGTVHASEPQYDIYMPVLMKPEPLPASTMTTAIGLELTADNITWYADELAAYNLGFIRGNLGNINEPYKTPYQLYLSGGWAAVDAKMLPNIEGWRGIGAEPLFIFMPGGACSVPSYALLDDFGDFVAEAVERYDMDYFEVWNEPDATSGYSALYGCFGDEYAGKLIYLLERIRPQLASHRQMGVSFMMHSADHFGMMVQVAPYVDFVGIHHYGIWSANQVLQGWPGSLELKYEMVKDAAGGKPVWITELNLRSPGDECGPAHQAAARDFVEKAFELDTPMINILVYKNYPDWQCTGMRETPLAALLMDLKNPNP